METDLSHPHLTPASAASIRQHVKSAAGLDVFMLGAVDGTGHLHSVSHFSVGADTAPIVAATAPEGQIVVRSVSRFFGRLVPSNADRWLARHLARRSIRLAIVDTKATEILLVPAKQPVAVTPEEVRAFFAHDGPLAAVVPGYEPREAQIIMAENIAGAISDRRALVVEAGTGVGKGLAYLVPAILWATRNDRTIVVVTHTINLQEQLLHSDIALLRRAGLACDVAVATGRDNYACLLKAHDTLRGIAEADTLPDGLAEAAALVEWAFSAGDDSDDTAQHIALAEWAFRSDTGAKRELDPPPSPAQWEHVRCETGACLHRDCEFYRRCHYYRARRRFLSAHIVIANQHLLCTDLALRRGSEITFGPLALPFYDRLIVDEAHHLDDVATDIFGTTIDTDTLRRVMRRVAGEPGRRPGMLRRTIDRLLRVDPFSPHAADHALLTTFIETHTLPAVLQLDAQLQAHLAQLTAAASAVRSHSALTRSAGDVRVRITPDLESTPAWQDDFVPAARSTAEDLDGIAGELWVVAERLKAITTDLRLDTETGTGPFAVDSAVNLEWNHVRLAADADRLATAAAGLFAFAGPMDPTDPPSVRWIETRSDGSDGLAPRALVLKHVPLWVGPELSKAIFSVALGGVFTSATLAVEDDFEDAERRLGLDRLERGRTIAFSVPSPFDYPANAALVVVDDLPDPTDAAQHIDRSVDVLARAITASKGRALVLTTSNAAMEKIHAQLWARLRPTGIRVINQREASRDRLAATLRAGGRVALVATRSFWEGVDVRGEALSLVAIARLPFPVPTDPLVAARGEHLDEHGGNGFRDHYVPAAVVAFKQGVGRLIRHRDDRGIVLVLDPRAANAAYGAAFTNLPGWAPPHILPSEEAARFVEAWFAR